MDVDKILNPTIREYTCFHAHGKFIKSDHIKKEKKKSDHILEHNVI